VSITQPSEEHNGVARWTEYFTGRRIAQLREMITPEILEEFRADPHGARGRSQALAQVLNFMRMQPIEDRVFAYAEVPFERYRLGSMHAERGVPPEIDESETFATENEAIFGVFVRRLEQLGIAPEKGAGDR
jgi:branched-chain amino acid transport system permease protein